MLSVGIPVHNKNITQLLSELFRQSEPFGALVEVLVFNDGSSSPVHDGLHLFPEVRVIYSQENVGRSAARNRLAKEAKGPFVLFLDSGSEIINPQFLKDWLTLLKEPKGLVYFGGSKYAQEPPDAAYQLRWRVGHARESKSLEYRTKNPTSFKTNNSVIHQQVLNALKFEERLIAYGHEDTLFGFELSQLGIEIHHVDNPVKNQIKDSNEAFLNKTKNAVENLLLARNLSSSPERFKHQVKLLKCYERIKAFHVQFLLTLLEKSLIRRLEKQLKQGNAFLLLQKFDLYKILLLHKASHQNTKVG